MNLSRPISSESTRVPSRLRSPLPCKEGFSLRQAKLHVNASTTESTLSVDEYHALQYKKRVEDKAAAPETILEGSSVFHTDGSMPTDYGSDISDVPMEDADSESAAVAHESVTGSRRPREDDPSASSSKRSRNDE
ncbi:hypothetical protein JG688_00007316, partial [Phytophthora aleatoria]